MIARYMKVMQMKKAQREGCGENLSTCSPRKMEGGCAGADQNARTMEVRLERSEVLCSMVKA